MKYGLSVTGKVDIGSIFTGVQQTGSMQSPGAGFLFCSLNHESAGSRTGDQRSAEAELSNHVEFFMHFSFLSAKIQPLCNQKNCRLPVQGSGSGNLQRLLHRMSSDRSLRFLHGAAGCYRLQVYYTKFQR